MKRLLVFNSFLNHPHRMSLVVLKWMLKHRWLSCITACSFVSLDFISLQLHKLHPCIQNILLKVFKDFFLPYRTLRAFRTLSRLRWLAVWTFFSLKQFSFRENFDMSSSLQSVIRKQYFLSEKFTNQLLRVKS